MAKLNVNLSSIVIGFLLGVSLMLLVGAKEYQTPHYQIHSTRSADGAAVCFVVDTYKGMVWEYSGGTWNPGETLPMYGKGGIPPQKNK
jgi:hypothetical protein